MLDIYLNVLALKWSFLSHIISTACRVGIVKNIVNQQAVLATLYPGPFLNTGVSEMMGWMFHLKCLGHCSLPTMNTTDFGCLHPTYMIPVCTYKLLVKSTPLIPTLELLSQVTAMSEASAACNFEQLVSQPDPDALWVILGQQLQLQRCSPIL